MTCFQPKTLVVCLMSAMSVSAFADTTSPSAPHVTLDKIVVNVETQVKQSLGVSVINQEDLERSPVNHDISQLIRKMPGVNLTGNSATGQRGNNRQIDIRGMGPENTLILVDGRPVNSRHAVRYGWRGERDTRGDLQWIPSGAIQSIEVLRGPAAARYGNGAMGGVVNIITKNISNELTGSAEVYTNQPQDGKEGESYRVNANISGAIVPDKLGFSLYGGYHKTKMDAPDINPVVPYKNSDNTTYLTRAAGREGVKNQDVGLRLAWQITPEHTLRFDTSQHHQSNEYAGDTQNSNRDATLTQSDSRTLASNRLLNSLIGQTTNKMHRQSHALTHDGKYTWGDSQTTLQYDQTKNTRLNEGLAGGPEGVIGSLDFEDTRLKTWRLHSQAHIPLKLGVPQTLTVGAEYVADDFVDTANTDEGTAKNASYASAFVSGDRSKMSSRIASVYAEDNLQLNDNTNLVLATRFDHHDKSGGNLSPAVNLVHHLDNHWVIKAGLARAYKAPNLYQSAEGYLLGTRGNGCPLTANIQGQWCVLQGNKDLKPETSTNGEIGVQYRDDVINASVNYFYNDYKNKIVSGTQILQMPTIGTTRYNLFKWENLPKALVEGIEANLTWKKGNVNWSNNLTYMINSVDKRTGNPLSLTPKYTLNSTLGVDINDQWDAQLTYTQYGRQKPRQFAENNIENATKDGLLHNPEVKSYGIVSVNTGYQFNPNISGRIGINNVFDDQKLRDNTQSQTYNESGRFYFASVKYQF